VSGISRIISGGQTGADRAALDFAIARGLSHGGWCPKGRKAEDGVIPPSYSLQETPSADYLQRTEWNVRDSDGTVIFSLAHTLSGGSLRTVEIARKLGRPWLHLPQKPVGSLPASLLKRFVKDQGIRILNVAGPRASKEPEVGKFVQETLNEAIGDQ